MIKAVFFDLDGVITITEPIHYAAWQDVLQKLLLPKDFFVLEDVIGISDFEMAEEIIEDFSAKVTPQKLVKMKREYYLSRIKKGLPSIRGRNEILERLFSKYILGLVSSSSKEEIRAVLKQEKLEKYFSFTIGYEDTLNHKPNPDPYLLALTRAKTKSNEAVAIEDSLVGLESAKKAGLIVYAMAIAISSCDKYPDIKFFDNFDELPL